jgi:hypothetical protein
MLIVMLECCSQVRSGWLKTLDQELRVKASTKFIERIAKHPGGWDLVKELSQRKAEVQKMIQGFNWLRSNYCVFVFGWHLVNFSLNPTTCPFLSLWNWTFQVWSALADLRAHSPHCATASCYFGAGLISLRSPVVSHASLDVCF